MGFTVLGATFLVAIIMNEATAVLFAIIMNETILACRFLKVEGSYLRVLTFVALEELHL